MEIFHDPEYLLHGSMRERGLSLVRSVKLVSARMLAWAEARGHDLLEQLFVPNVAVGCCQRDTALLGQMHLLKP